MTAPAQRMKDMRARRRASGRREVRLLVPDARSPAVRLRVAAAVASLVLEKEEDALDWIESVAIFDEVDDASSGQ